MTRRRLSPLDPRDDYEFIKGLVVGVVVMAIGTSLVAFFLCK